MLPSLFPINCTKLSKMISTLLANYRTLIFSPGQEKRDIRVENISLLVV